MNFLTAQVLSDTVSSLDLSGVLDGMTAMLPVAAPVVVGAIALKKGWGFLKSLIKGA